MNGHQCIKGKHYVSITNMGNETVPVLAPII